MKIGILTYHRAINIGSIMQAYCTQSVFQRLFPDAWVEVIDYRPGRRDYEESYRYLKRRPPFVDRRRLGNIRRLRRLMSDCLDLSPSHVTTRDESKAADFIRAQGYDVVVVGSDTVWEYRPNAYAPQAPNIFHLPGDLGARKVGWCVSADPVPRAEDIPNTHRAEIVRRIEDFDFVILRDAPTHDLLIEIGIPQKRLHILPDPTFMAPIDDLVEPYEAARGSRPVLGLDLPPAMEQRVAATGRALGYDIWTWKPSSPGGDFDHRLPANLPARQLLGAYHRVDAFVTERFHSSIFTMKVGGVAPIFIEDSGKWQMANSKGRSLYRLAGIEDRVLSDNDPEFNTRLAALLAQGRVTRALPEPPAGHEALIRQAINGAA